MIWHYCPIPLGKKKEALLHWLHVLLFLWPFADVFELAASKFQKLYSVYMQCNLTPFYLDAMMAD